MTRSWSGFVTYGFASSRRNASPDLLFSTFSVTLSSIYEGVQNKEGNGRREERGWRGREGKREVGRDRDMERRRNEGGREGKARRERVEGIETWKEGESEGGGRENEGEGGERD